MSNYLKGLLTNEEVIQELLKIAHEIAHGKESDKALDLNDEELDCSAAAQNILLAAESLGLGAVWTAAYPYEDRMQVVRKYTGLPENILPLCVIPFGYPATKENPKQKFDEKKIHYNQY